MRLTLIVAVMLVIISIPNRPIGLLLLRFARPALVHFRFMGHFRLFLVLQLLQCLVFNVSGVTPRSWSELAVSLLVVYECIFAGKVFWGMSAQGRLIGYRLAVWACIVLAKIVIIGVPVAVWVFTRQQPNAAEIFLWSNVAISVIGASQPWLYLWFWRAPFRLKRRSTQRPDLPSSVTAYFRLKYPKKGKRWFRWFV